MTNKLEMNRAELVIELFDKGFEPTRDRRFFDEKECACVMLRSDENGLIVEAWDIGKDDHAYHYINGYTKAPIEYDLKPLQLEK